MTETHQVENGIGTPQGIGESHSDLVSILLPLTAGLKQSITEWEGVLKADGRAHTRELSEFSAEMSEVIKDMKGSVTALVREAVEHETSRDAEWRLMLKKTEQNLERKLARLERIALILGAAFLSLAALVLYRWYF